MTDYEPVQAGDDTEMSLTIQQKKAIRAWAKKQPLIAAAYLFGSRAKGTARPDSDADIALRLSVPDEQVKSAFILLGEEWQFDLSELIGLKVSIAHLAGDLTPIHETAVLDHGIRIYSRKA